MKKLITMIALTLPFTVQAQEVNPNMEICKAIHSLAETIMERRQEGMSIVKMLEVAGNSDNGFVRSFSELMVKDTFDSTRYHSPELQQRAVQDFGNDMFLLCMDVMEGEGK